MDTVQVQTIENNIKPIVAKFVKHFFLFIAAFLTYFIANLFIAHLAIVNQLQNIKLDAHGNAVDMESAGVIFHLQDGPFYSKESILRIHENPTPTIIFILICTAIILSCTYLVYRKINTFGKLNFSKKTLYATAIFMLVILAYRLFANTVFSYMNMDFVENNRMYFSGWQGVGFHQSSTILILGFTALIFAPILETLIFIGIGFEIFSFKNKYISLVICALLFGAFHLAKGSYTALFIYFGLGLILGYSYMKTKNIIAPIILQGLYSLIFFIPFMFK